MTMPNARACYRKLRHYKYQLTENYLIRIEIQPESPIGTKFIDLTTSGVLTMKAQYAWDGPSGISIDTKSFMRGSLVHDVLYQLMRGRYLDYLQHREYADDLLRRICLEDGMSRFRAWYVYQSVRTFGEKFARPSKELPPKIICVPE